MMRTTTLFNRATAGAQSIKIIQPPTVSASDNQYATTMKYNNYQDGAEFDLEAIVPHGKISSFASLLRNIAELPPESAAMVTLAHAECIPPTAQAVDQLKAKLEPFHDLNAYLRSELNNLYNARLDTAELAASTSTVLTNFY